jgi:hypothetical protein
MKKIVWHIFYKYNHQRAVFHGKIREISGTEMNQKSTINKPFEKGYIKIPITGLEIEIFNVN